MNRTAAIALAAVLTVAIAAGCSGSSQKQERIRAGDPEKGVFFYTLVSTDNSPIRVTFEYASNHDIKTVSVDTPEPSAGGGERTSKYTLMSNESKAINVVSRWTAGQDPELMSITILPPEPEGLETSSGLITEEHYVESLEGFEVIVRAVWESGELRTVELREAQPYFTGQ